MREQLLEEMRRDELAAAIANDAAVGPNQQVVDRLCKKKANQKHADKGQHRINQPRSELDKMLHQRRFRGLNGLAVAPLTFFPLAQCDVGHAATLLPP